MTEAQLVKAVYKLREREYKATEALNAVKAKLDDTERKLLEQMEKAGTVSTANYAGIGKFTSQTVLWPSFKKGDALEVAAWLKSIGRADVIAKVEETKVGIKDLREVVESCLQEGKPLPEVVNVAYKTTLKKG